MRSIRLATIVLTGLTAACTALLGDFEVTGASGGSGSLDGGDIGADGQAARVAITPAELKLGVLRPQVFTASGPVTWSVEEPDGGRIDESGRYVSPPKPGEFHVVATSKDDPSAVTKAKVTVVDLQLTVVAGPAAGNGTVDGPAQVAHLNHPEAIAQPKSGGAMFIADTGSHTIRRLAGGVVSTLAGEPLQPGFANGTGASARFNRPRGIAVKGPLSGAKTVFVADTENHCIRRINGDTGAVDTLTGSCGNPGQADGLPGQALFDTPSSMTISDDGNRLYVCDLGSAQGNKRLIRQIHTTTGVVSQALGTSLSSCVLGTVDFNGGQRNRVFFADYDMLASFKDPGSASTSYDKLVSGGLPEPYADGLANDTGFGGGRSIYVSFRSKRAIYAVRPEDTTPSFALLVGDPAQSTNVAVNGTFSEARFAGPTGLSQEGGGPLFVADSSASAIRKVDLDNRTVTDHVGKSVQYGHVDAARAAARFALVTGIAMGPDDTAYVTDASSDGGRISGTIRAIHLATGAVSTLAGLVGRHPLAEDGAANAAKFAFPWDIGRDGDFLYVADLMAHAIRKVAIRGGSVTTLAGKLNVAGDSVGVGVAASFKQPSGVASDGAGTLFVSDTGNFKIKKIVLATGAVSVLAGGTQGSADGVGAAAQFKAPAGLAYEGGNLYVADSADHTVRKIVVATGEVSTLIGQHGVFGFDSGGPAAAKLFGPARLAADGIGGLYVAEGFVQDFDKSVSGAMRRIDIATRTIAPFMGRRMDLGIVPGPLATARVNFPLGIAVTPKGDLVFTDLYDYTIGMVQAL